MTMRRKHFGLGCVLKYELERCLVYAKDLVLSKVYTSLIVRSAERVVRTRQAGLCLEGIEAMPKEFRDGCSARIIR